MPFAPLTTCRVERATERARTRADVGSKLTMSKSCSPTLRQVSQRNGIEKIFSVANIVGFFGVIVPCVGRWEPWLCMFVLDSLVFFVPNILRCGLSLDTASLLLVCEHNLCLHCAARFGLVVSSYDSTRRSSSRIYIDWCVRFDLHRLRDLSPHS